MLFFSKPGQVSNKMKLRNIIPTCHAHVLENISNSATESTVILGWTCKRNNHSDFHPKYDLRARHCHPLLHRFQPKMKVLTTHNLRVLQPWPAYNKCFAPFSNGSMLSCLVVNNNYYYMQPHVTFSNLLLLLFTFIMKILLFVHLVIIVFFFLCIKISHPGLIMGWMNLSLETSF